MGISRNLCLQQVPPKGYVPPAPWPDRPPSRSRGCKYCGRTDGADGHGNCRGCGAERDDERPHRA